MQRWIRVASFRVSLIYFVVGSLWILLSDRALEWWVPDASQYGWLQTYKGWFFVVTTSLLLYLLLRLEERLRRQAEVEYQRLFAASPDALFLVTPSGRILNANAAAIGLYGYSRAELLNLSLLDLSTSSIDSAVPAALKQKNDRFEMQHRCKDGSGLVVEIRTQQLSLKGELVTLCSVRDISVNKRMENQLRDSEQRFRFLVENAGDAFYLVDSQGKILEANNAACQASGYTRAELLEMQVEDLEQIHGLPQVIARRLKAQPDDPITVEGIIRRKDGSTFPVEICITESEDRGRKLLLCLARDITERKLVEQALQADKDHYQSLFFNSPTPLWEVDFSGAKAALDALKAQGVVDFRQYFPQPGDWLVDYVDGIKILAFNDAVLRLYDVQDRERALKNIRSLFGADANRALTEVLVRIAEGQLFFDLELSIQTVRQEKRVVILHWAAATGSEHTLDRVYISVSDITDRVRAEAEVRALNADLEQRVTRRTAQLQSLLKEMESFTYSVSHDLKAPLRGIDGYSRLLEEDYAAQLGEEGRVFLGNIRRGAQQMAHLIDDLLAYSRLERRALVSGPLMIREMVNAVLDEYAEPILQSGTDVRVEIPFDSLEADSQGVTQVLHNLIENAIKFTRGVPSPRIEIGGRETPEAWLLWVHDNGIGFDMQYHDRIFQIFQRLHRAEDYDGTGVGLAIVRKAMERMGGRVWADSTPGGGATFHLEFRRHP